MLPPPPPASSPCDLPMAERSTHDSERTGRPASEQAVQLMRAMLRHNSEQLEQLAAAEEQALHRAEVAEQRAQQSSETVQRLRTEAQLQAQRLTEAQRQATVAARQQASMAAGVDSATRARDSLLDQVRSLDAELHALRATLQDTRLQLEEALPDPAPEQAGLAPLERSAQEHEEQLRTRAIRAEEARDRAQQGSASFRRMVEEAQGRALQAQQAAEDSTRRTQELERLAAQSEQRAEDAEQLVAELELAARPAPTDSLHSLQEQLAAARLELSKLRQAHHDQRRMASEQRAEAQAAETVRTQLLALSDSQRLRELTARANALWPAHPTHTGAYEQWLTEAEAVALTQEEHRLTRRALARLDDLLTDEEREHGWVMGAGGWAALRRVEDEQGEPVEPPRREEVLAADPASGPVPEPNLAGGLGRQAWQAVDLAWWCHSLDELLADIDRLLEPESGLLQDVQRRLEVARHLEQRSLTGPGVARAWHEAMDDVADPQRCPAYGGLSLQPMLGLRPVGKDPQSGLWEFAMPHTGTVPQRRADGSLGLALDHALVFVLIPGGRARLGAQAQDPAVPHYDSQARSNEGPVHEASMAPFFLAKHCMTQAQWQLVMGNNPSRYGPGTTVGGVQHSLQHPVENVSWDECQEAMWRLGLALPEERQWEYAARAGTSTPWWTGPRRDTLAGAVNLADRAARRGGARWASIADWPELDDGYTTHAPVDHGSANPFGLHAVHGNVWEWCRGPLTPYKLGAQPENSTPDGDAETDTGAVAGRVYRGGGFRNTSGQSRVSSRLSEERGKRASDLGLRPVFPFPKQDDSA